MKIRRIRSEDASRATRAEVDPATARETARIVGDVRTRGELALREHAERLGDWSSSEPFVFDRSALEEAALKVDDRDLALLRRTADRIRNFATAQRRAITDMNVVVPGGRAGHTIEPVERAGCFAPGGGFASAILMTAVTARAAGVREVWAASPRPDPIVLAAAHVAGVDALVAVGGVPAIAALAHGAGSVPACDAVVGSGDRWIWAAKEHVAGRVVIDVSSGPHELVILADASADPALVAADLIAQAEHVDALPILVSLDEALVERVERELDVQTATLTNAPAVRRALDGCLTIVEPDLKRAIHVVDELAPAHLQLMLQDSSLTAYLVRHCGALSVGAQSAKVLSEYGAGPNDVLPAARGARSRAGLSVFTFLRVRAWIETTDPAQLAGDAARFARLEGYEAHARAAERRVGR